LTSHNSNYTTLITDFKEKLGDKLEIQKGVLRELLLLELEKMDFLVNLSNVNRPNQIPSKLIDYAITERPILNVNPTRPNQDELYSFLSENYKSAYKVENIEKYKISNVCSNFTKLIEYNHL
jgi:hypothetical protein